VAKLEECLQYYHFRGYFSIPLRRIGSTNMKLFYCVCTRSAGQLSSRYRFRHARHKQHCALRQRQQVHLLLFGRIRIVRHHHSTHPFRYSNCVFIRSMFGLPLTCLTTVFDCATSAASAFAPATFVVLAAPLPATSAASASAPATFVVLKCQEKPELGSLMMILLLYRI